MQTSLVTCAFLLFFASASPAPADKVCTLLVDVPTGAVVLEDGDCHTRVTPASTFKIPLAVMGYDASILTDAHSPSMSFRQGDPDWGGDNWTRDTDPARWMLYSVLWYSQRIAHAMGPASLTDYARRFAYGNADFSGDRGFDNGMERAWIASSLQVSPHEQAGFMRRLVLNALPVRRDAMEHTRAIVEARQVGKWVVHGKTGSAYPRRADRSFDYARGWGWYVGWAQSADSMLVFVTLTQARERSSGSPGNRTREAFLMRWPHLIHP